MTDMNEGHGGCYVITEKGERLLVEAPTRNHPEGNRPRPAPDKPAPESDVKTKPVKGGK